MRLDAESSEGQSGSGIIAAVKTPPRFFVLAAPIAESVLITIVAIARGTNRTIIIVGMIAALLVALVAVLVLARRRTDPRAEYDAGRQFESDFLDGGCP